MYRVLGALLLTAFILMALWRPGFAATDVVGIGFTVFGALMLLTSKS